MKEAIITTQTVAMSSDGKSVEFVATLDAGELAPGMFLHIPMSFILDFTVAIKKVAPLSPPNFHVALDCDDDEDGAAFVVAFNFDNETLWVDEVGER
jgi:hypothetical protein